VSLGGLYRIVFGNQSGDIYLSHTSHRNVSTHCTESSDAVTTSEINPAKRSAAYPALASGTDPQPLSGCSWGFAPRTTYLVGKVLLLLLGEEPGQRAI